MLVVIHHGEVDHWGSRRTLSQRSRHRSVGDKLLCVKRHLVLVAAAKWLYLCGTDPSTYHLLAIMVTNHMPLLRF